jgi:coenzyme F420-reducing hydrogenase beta subunit
MININDNGINKCTGCGICAVICPNKSITIVHNHHGFFVPIINGDACNKCGICLTVCYKYLSDDANRKYNFDGKKVFAAIDNDRNELSTVTSGGVANRFAFNLFEEGYNVCGVVFDPRTNICKHTVAEHINDLGLFKKSKYLQSNSYEAFSNLDEKKKNLVFGTPCQIYGLRNFIQKKNIEQNFILVDVFCRGVPTSLLWRSYKEYIQRVYKLGEFRLVNFKDKSISWHNFSIRIVDDFGKLYLKSVYEDLFYSFYLKNACLNEACYDCKLRHEGIYSDVRLGDFWGEKFNSYDKGVSLVVVSTKRGEELWERIKKYFYSEECNVEDIFKSQRFNKYPKHLKYDEILSSLADGEKLEIVHKITGLDTEKFYKLPEKLT